MKIKFSPMLVAKFVGAAIALAVAFGLGVTEEQKQALTGIVGVILAISVGQGLFEGYTSDGDGDIIPVDDTPEPPMGLSAS